MNTLLPTNWAIWAILEGLKNFLLESGTFRQALPRGRNRRPAISLTLSLIATEEMSSFEVV